MTETVGIVIVSHSRDIAKGTADMVRQMVGSEVKVAFCGGNPDGGLGTTVSLIIDAINDAWTATGVAMGACLYDPAFATLFRRCRDQQRNGGRDAGACTARSRCRMQRANRRGGRDGGNRGGGR